MRDVVFIAVTVGFFGLAAAYIGACARIVGREELVEVEPAVGVDGIDGIDEVDAERAGALP